MGPSPLFYTEARCPDASNIVLLQRCRWDSWRLPSIWLGARQQCLRAFMGFDLPGGHILPERPFDTSLLTAPLAGTRRLYDAMGSLPFLLPPRHTGRCALLRPAAEGYRRQACG